MDRMDVVERQENGHMKLQLKKCNCNRLRIVNSGGSGGGEGQSIRSKSNSNPIHKIKQCNAIHLLPRGFTLHTCESNHGQSCHGVSC